MFFANNLDENHLLTTAQGEDTALIDETTCGELESTSSTISAGGILCESYKLAAFTCCPADASFGSWLGESSNVTNPCNLCPNGVIDESALVMAPGDDPENASTCAESLPLYSSLEKESDQCLYSSTLVQQSCCPEEANPCEICPGGVSDGAVLPGDEGEEKLLCSEVVESGMFLPANSELCESTKVVASFCCPGDVQQQANPCSSESLINSICVVAVHSHVEPGFLPHRHLHSSLPERRDDRGGRGFHTWG